MTLPPRLRVVALVAAIAASLAIASPAAAHHDPVATVLPNAGFESDNDGNGVPDGWAPIGGDVRTDAASAHGGSRSLRVTGADAGAAASAVRVAVPSEVYEYAALAKLDNVDGAFLRAVFRSDRGRVLATRDSPVLSGTRGWSRLLLTAATPDDAATVSVELHQRGAGVTWFDDVWVAAKTSANLLEEGSAERHDGTTPTGWTARSTHSTAVTVPNADIESAGSGANPASWVQMTWKGTGTRSWDGTVARSGSHSLKIVGQPAGLTGWRMQDYPVISEGEYRFSVWVKANGTINSGATPTIIFYNAAGQTIGSDRVVTTPAGTYDWTQIQSTVTTPKGAVKARFDLRLNDVGTVWFDDVSIARRELAPGVGDGVTAGWDATQPYDGHGDLALTSQDANAEVLLQAAPVAIAPLERYTLTGAVRTEHVSGGASVGVQFVDGDGTVVGTTTAAPVSGSSDWQTQSLAVYPPPSAVDAIAVVRLSGEGEARFDRLRLTRANVENRLANPSFEQADTMFPGQPDGWTLTHASWSTDAYTGARAVELRDGTLATDPVALPASGRYTASAWAKGHKARLCVQFLDADGHVLATKRSRSQTRGQWTRLALTANAPAGATKARFSASGKGREGTSFDDLALAGPVADHPTLLFSRRDIARIRARHSQGPLAAEYARQRALSDQWTVAQLKDPTYLSNPFRRTSLIFDAPAGATSMKVNLNVAGRGQVRVDDVTLSALTTLQAVDVPNGGFESDGGWSARTLSGAPKLAPTQAWAVQGTRSYEYDGTAASDEATLALDAALPAKGGDRYSLAYAFNQQGLIAGRGSTWEITFYGPDGAVVGSTVRSTPYNWDTHTRWDSPLFEATQASADVYLMEGDRVAARKAALGLRYLLDESVWGMTATLAGGGARPNGEDGYGAVHFGRAMGGYSLTYDLIRDSGVLTPEEDAYIRDRLAWMQDTMMNTAYYDYTTPSGRISNWNSDRAVGVGFASIVAPEFTLSADYRQHAEGEISWVLDNVVGQDGAYPETIRYHVAPLLRMAPFAQALARAGGADLIHSEQLKRMFKLLIEVQTPPDQVNMFVPGAVLTPAIGDADYTENAMRLLGWHAALYQTTDPQLAGEMQWTWKRAGSPVRDTGANPWPLLPFLYTDGDLPSTPVDLKSTTISTLGYEILRNDVGTPSEDYLVMVNPSRALGHQHDDRTSFSLWADQTPLSLDSGVGGYFNGDNIWFNSASAHNVVQFSQADGTWSGTPATVNVTDRYRSDALDSVQVKVSPTYDRTIASIKGDVDAYVIWDRSDGTQASRFNLHTLSTSIDGTGNHLVAHGYNNEDLDIDVLGDDPPNVKLDTGRISGEWPQTDQQWLQLGSPAGHGHLVVLFPRNRAAAGLKITRLAAGAYELTTAGGSRVILAVNRQAQDTTASLPVDGSFTDLRTGQTRTADDGTLSVPIPGQAIAILKA